MYWVPARCAAFPVGKGLLPPLKRFLPPNNAMMAVKKLIYCLPTAQGATYSVVKGLYKGFSRQTTVPEPKLWAVFSVGRDPIAEFHYLLYSDSPHCGFYTEMVY